MACAFGMEACKQYYTVKYVRLPDLLLDLQAARADGNFVNVLKKYTNPLLLIIDEWLLLKLTESEARDLFELIHKRRKEALLSFAHSIVSQNGISRSVAVKVPLQMQSWIAYLTIHTKSILKVRIHPKISQ